MVGTHENASRSITTETFRWLIEISIREHLFGDVAGADRAMRCGSLLEGWRSGCRVRRKTEARFGAIDPGGFESLDEVR